MKRITLPFPPSINDYYEPVRAGRHARIRLNDKAKLYRERVVGMLRNVGHPLEGRLYVRVTLCASFETAYDLDNRMKGLLDALEHAGVFNNDDQIDHLEIIRGPIKDIGRVIVETEVICDRNTRSPIRRWLRDVLGYLRSRTPETRKLEVTDLVHHLAAVHGVDRDETSKKDGE